MQTLTRDQLRTSCPSVFTRSAYHAMSDRYRVAATADVLDLLEGIGLFPVRAQQSRCRLPDKKNYVKHMIRFRRAQDMDAGQATEIPEVVLTNSFDGSSAYKLLLGIYKISCTNGLVCPIGDLGGFSVRHSGGDDFNRRIIDASYRVVSEAPMAMETVKAWKQIELTPPQQEAYATAALEVIDSPRITPAQLLTPRRREDAKPDLWHTMNRVQEAATKGGIHTRNERGRRSTTRPITGVDRDLKLNKALWVLAEKLAEAVS